ncbi:hypothetical protein GW17_00055019 [Ensete ventricosum]|nr:hypothetical protein GW17_00055019 [Ensete ventricosum]
MRNVRVSSQGFFCFFLHERATCRETCTCGSGRGPRYTVLICVGPCNSSEIVMAQKQIWSAETNRAPFDLPEAEAELVAGYNVEYERDAILKRECRVVLRSLEEGYSEPRRRKRVRNIGVKDLVGSVRFLLVGKSVIG